jgi:hypothetical protein
MNARLSLLALIAIATVVLSAPHLQAAGNGELVLVVDRDTGNMSLTGASSTVVNLAGYVIESNRGSISTANFNGLSDTEPDWVAAGIASANNVQELINSGTTVSLIDNMVTLDLGTPAYNRTAAINDAGFGVNFEQNDLSLTFYDALNNSVYAGAITFTGTELLNNIGITVNLADGTAMITNDSTFNQVITGYLIEAATDGTLNTNLATFNGLRDETGGGSFQTPSVLSGNSLGELDPTGVGIALDAGESYNLGVVGGALDDLSFSFLLAGMGQTSRTGFITYLNAGLSGDFNNDGLVDAADYTVWRDNLGAADESGINNNGDGGGVTESDYQVWRTNFGNSSGAGALAAAAASVPEPASVVVSLAAIVTIGCFSRRGRRA